MLIPGVLASQPVGGALPSVGEDTGNFLVDHNGNRFKTASGFNLIYVDPIKPFTFDAAASDLTGDYSTPGQAYFPVIGTSSASTYLRRECIGGTNLLEAFPSGRIYVEVAVLDPRFNSNNALVSSGVFYGGGNSSPNDYTHMGLATPRNTGPSTQSPGLVEVENSAANIDAYAPLGAMVWGVEAFGTNQRFKRVNTTGSTSSTNYNGSQLYFYEESVIMIAVDYSDAMAAVSDVTGTVRYWLGRNGTWLGAGGPDANPTGLHTYTYNGTYPNPFFEHREELDLRVFFSLDSSGSSPYHATATVYGGIGLPFNYTVPTGFNVLA